MIRTSQQMRRFWITDWLCIPVTDDMRRGETQYNKYAYFYILTLIEIAEKRLFEMDYNDNNKNEIYSRHK